jgi:nucleoside-diphosphate-sugar epimerase
MDFLCERGTKMVGEGHERFLMKFTSTSMLRPPASLPLRRAARSSVRAHASVRAPAGLSADCPITEEDKAAPTDAYGRAKLQGERRVAASGVSFTVLRPAVAYGKGLKGNIAALATLARTPIAFRGSAVSLVLHAKKAANDTFLVADAEPISVAGLVAGMREGLGRLLTSSRCRSGGSCG